MTDVDDWHDYRDDDWEPDPTDYLEQKAQEEHEDEVHGGQPCNCPVPTEAEIKAQWEKRAAEHRAEAHAGGKCDCPPEEPPF